MNVTGSAVTLNPGDRLVRLAATIPIFKERGLTVADNNPISTDPATGRGRTYLGRERFDWVASGTGLTPRVYSDVRGRHSPHWVNVRDFPTIQAAVDAAVARRIYTVYVPAGYYYRESIPAFIPPLVFPQDSPLRLLGDGPRATILQNANNLSFPFPPDADLIHIRGDYQTVEGLTLRGNLPFDPATGVGIRIRRGGGPADDKRITYRVHIRDVEIVTTPGWGIMIDETPFAGVEQIAVYGIYENVEIQQTEGGNPGSTQGGPGIYVGSGNTTTQWFYNCRINNFSHHALLVKANGAALAFVNCIFESGLVADEYVKLENANNILFSHCYFEGVNVVSGPAFQPYVRINGGCRGISLNDCLWVQRGTSLDKDMKAVYVESGARGISVRDPFFYVPGNTEQGEGRHIIVEPPPASLNWDEFRLEGGNLNDAVPGSRVIKVFDGAVDVGMGPMSRVRMARFAATEISALANKVVGDMVFNTTSGKAQVWDGGTWQNLW